MIEIWTVVTNLLDRLSKGEPWLWYTDTESSPKQENDNLGNIRQSPKQSSGRNTLAQRSRAAQGKQKSPPTEGDRAKHPFQRQVSV